MAAYLTVLIVARRRAQVFLLRLQEGDLELLSDAGMLQMLRRLHTAHGRMRRLCSCVFKHLILCTFVDRSPATVLSPFQAYVLGMLRAQLALLLDELCAK